VRSLLGHWRFLPPGLHHREQGVSVSPTYQLKTQFDNVAGLAEGADVQVGGVHSGMVRSIELPHKLGTKSQW